MKAPFYIENRTGAPVRAQQKGWGQPTAVPPRTTVPFAFERPSAEKVLLLRIYDTEVEYALTFVKV